MMRVLVVCPHFAPDTAPTGVVMTRIVDELAARGHEVHVVTALPWYREHAIEQGWTGRLLRTDRTAWGSITRVHPFPGDDRRDLVRRALGFLGFTVLVAVAGLRAGGWFRRVDAVLATLSPREARILRLRFGLDDNHPYTLEEVGGWVDLVRAILIALEARALLATGVAVIGVALTLLLARHRRRAGAVLATGVLAGCLAMMFIAGRVVNGSTAVVSDPALAAVIHGSIEQAAAHLTRRLWLVDALMVVLAAVLMVLHRRSRPSPAPVGAG